VRRYFGETSVTACGVCDLCLNPPEAADVTEAAQKALSAVHRLGGRFGRTRVVDHLLGKTKDSSASETAMSTYGIGREFSAAGWRDLLDQLMFDGLLHEDPNDGRPLIGLGEAEGVGAVYRGERRISMRRAPAVADSDASGRRARKRRVGGDSQEVDAANMALFEALRAWRRDRAAEQHVPPYVIFHDATLADIARLRPKNKDELKGVSGVGQSKLQRYGAAVLELVRQH
jgi:ATP-dependent DNA helicase RecQ